MWLGLGVPIAARPGGGAPVLLQIVQDYEDLIISGGSTVESSVITVLNNELKTLQTHSVYAKLKELWIPCGSDNAAAYVKLISATGALNPMTASATAPTYSQAAGMQGVVASSTFLSTGMTPTGADFTDKDWGFGVYNLSPYNTTFGGVLGGTETGATSYLAESIAGSYGINGVVIDTGERTALKPQPRLNAVQVTGSEMQVYLNGYLERTRESTNSNTNVKLKLLSAVNAYHSNAKIGGYAAWSPALTDAEFLRLTQFFDSVNDGLLRSAFTGSLLALGDSNTAGSGDGVNATNRWSYLVASALGLANTSGAEINTAIGGSTMIDWPANPTYQCYGVDRPRLATQLPSPLTVIMLGTNDAGAGLDITAFTSAYSTYVARQIAGGIAPETILLISPPWADFISAGYTATQETLTPFVAAVASIASVYGTLYFDANAFTVGNSPAWYQADDLHLNVSGHAALAGALTTYLEANGY